MDGPEESVRQASDLLSTVIESLSRDPELSDEDIQALLRQDLRAASRGAAAIGGEPVG